MTRDGASLVNNLARVVLGAAILHLLTAQPLTEAGEASTAGLRPGAATSESPSPAVSVTGDVQGVAKGISEAEAATKASKPLAARSSLSGINVNRHVPVQQLPEGKTVYVFDALYRVIGQDARYSRLESSGMIAAMRTAWARLNAVPAFEIEMGFAPAVPAPGSSEDPCEPGEDKEFCSMRSFEGARDYFAVDLTVRTGITRGTLFPGIGEKEWTYNRLQDAALRDRGYDARVTIMGLKLVPEGLHVLKHVPFTEHYSEETVLQLVGLHLMPFSMAKQNLLQLVLDCLGLNNMAGVGYLRISHVSEAWKWTKEGGDVGIANITLVTIRERPMASIGEALNATLPRLLEMMDQFGLKHLAGSVLSSRPLRNNTLADEMTAALPADERVRSYDSRVPFETLPPVWPVPPAIVIAHWVAVAAWALATLAAIAGTYIFLQSGNRARTASPDTNPFAFLVDELGPENSISESARQSQLSMGGSGLSMMSPPNPFQGQFEGTNRHSASFHGQQDAIVATGDSATETAGIAGIPEERRRQQIKKEMERASTIHGWEIDPGDIVISKLEDGSDHLLGVGGYGRVYKGMRSGVQDIAIKMLSYSNDLQLQQFCLEIRLLKSLSFDRNVVQFYGACLHDDHPMLVLEYMEGGDLRNAISGPLREELSWYRNGQHLALDIVRGICFLHNNRVIHGDLKSRNILLTRNAGTAKISDVGMARIMTTTVTAQSFNPTPPGTFSHAAPELLLGQRCTAKADVFSYGVTLWELITGEIPIRGRLRPVKVPEECPQVIYDLIDRCLEAEPQARPTSKEVFEIIRAARSEQPAPLRSESLNSSGALRNRISMSLSQVAE